ncbi:hypothetical protein VTN77DRAFT_8274 [Rasamsonia byssochlamydoides]|uniref:uncharacterized protein n=1 Tax=Rasamsonia byssochlamydoides TaxID=89139 RepID=UPI0037423A86
MAKVPTQRSCWASPDISRSFHTLVRHFYFHHEDDYLVSHCCSPFLFFFTKAVAADAGGAPSATVAAPSIDSTGFLDAHVLYINDQTLIVNGPMILHYMRRPQTDLAELYSDSNAVGSLTAHRLLTSEVSTPSLLALSLAIILFQIVVSRWLLQASTGFSVPSLFGDQRSGLI